MVSFLCAVAVFFYLSAGLGVGVSCAKRINEATGGDTWDHSLTVIAMFFVPLWPFVLTVWVAYLLPTKFLK